MVTAVATGLPSTWSTVTFRFARSTAATIPATTTTAIATTSHHQCRNHRMTFCHHVSRASGTSSVIAGPSQRVSSGGRLAENATGVMEYEPASTCGWATTDTE